MIALIDADSIIYRVGFVLEEKLDFKEYDNECDIETTYYIDIELAKLKIANLLDTIQNRTMCSDMLVVVSGKKNFRYDVDATYKHNRTNRKPTGYQEMYNYLTTFNSVVTDGYEADDYVVYLKTKYPNDYVLCAIDKDVLYQTVGNHYNYMKEEWVKVTEAEATRFFWYQVIVGDVTDGYPGLPKVGKKGAELILNTVTSSSDYRQVVLKEFLGRGFDEDYFLTQCRLASMHQLKDVNEGISIVLYN